MAQCVAKARRSGQRCRRHALRGSTVCLTHGGSTRHIRRAAEQRQADLQALKALERLEVQPLGNPLDELINLAAKLKATCERLEQRVGDLDKLHTWGETGEQIKAEVALWERFLDRTRTCLVDIARLGLDERLVRISERQGALILQVIEGVLGDLGVNPNEEAASASLDRHLALAAAS